MPGIEVTCYNEYELDETDFEDACQEAFDDIVSRTPVDTGTCAAGWDIRFSSGECTITNDVEYTSYLEEGHSKQAPSGFVERTLDRYSQYFTYSMSYI